MGPSQVAGNPAFVRFRKPPFRCYVLPPKRGLVRRHSLEPANRHKQRSSYPQHGRGRRRAAHPAARFPLDRHPSRREPACTPPRCPATGNLAHGVAARHYLPHRVLRETTSPSCRLTTRANVQLPQPNLLIMTEVASNLGIFSTLAANSPSRYDAAQLAAVRGADVELTGTSSPRSYLTTDGHDSPVGALADNVCRRPRRPLARRPRHARRSGRRRLRREHDHTHAQPPGIPRGHPSLVRRILTPSKATPSSPPPS